MVPSFSPSLTSPPTEILNFLYINSIFYLQIMDSHAPSAANGTEPEVAYVDTKSTAVRSQINHPFCIAHCVRTRIVGRTIWKVIWKCISTNPVEMRRSKGFVRRKKTWRYMTHSMNRAYDKLLLFFSYSYHLIHSD